MMVTLIIITSTYSTCPLGGIQELKKEVRNYAAKVVAKIKQFGRHYAKVPIKTGY